jgi:hypothetical protein
MVKAKVLPIDYLQNLSRSILGSINVSEIEKGLRIVLEYYGIINFDPEYTLPFWRGRICASSDGFKNIKELSYPPRELTKAGRLNEPHAPLLYLSLNNLTTLVEINASKGNYVHSVAYKIIGKNKMKCGILGEITHVARSGRALISEELGNELNRILNKTEYEAGKSFVFTDAFLSSILRDRDASKTNYIHSRTLAKLIFEKNPEFDAIIYPSIALESAMNLAIKPESADRLLEIFGTSVMRVRKKYDYGIFDFELLKNAKGYEKNGDIRWDKNFEPISSPGKGFPGD